MQEAAAKKKSFKNCNWLLLAAAAARIYERSPLLVVVQKKSSRNRCFSRKKRSSVETHEFSGGKRERVPGSNSAALALDSPKKSTTTAADKRNFGKGPLLRNSPKKWEKTSSSSVCSYLRQRAEHSEIES